MRRSPKIKKGRCVICGKYWVAKMRDYGSNIASGPCPYCNTTPCVMDFLDDYVIGTSAMTAGKALKYVVTLDTQNECELAIREEIFGRKNNVWPQRKARVEVIEAIMLRYDFLDEAGVTERGAPRLTPKELIAHHLGKGG